MRHGWRDQGVNFARQFGGSLAARRHNDVRAVRLFDGDRLIANVVNDRVPLDHVSEPKTPADPWEGSPLGLAE